MATICDNPKCTYHRQIQAKLAGAPYIDTMEGDERVRVNRYLYRSGAGRDFFLCDVCHEAVKMTASPR